MYNYFLGVVTELRRHFDLSACVFCGASAGAVASLVLALDELDPEYVFEHWNMPLLRDINRRILGAFLNWYDIMESHMLMRLPTDAYKNLNGRLHVSMTRVNMGFSGIKMTNEIVCDYDSNEDVFNCIMSSAYVPLFGKRPFRSHRGNWYIDGALTNNRPKPFPHAKAIEFDIERWRKMNPIWYWCWSDERWARQAYDWGRTDVRNNLDELAFDLPMRSITISKEIKQTVYFKKRPRKNKKRAHMRIYTT